MKESDANPIRKSNCLTHQFRDGECKIHHPNLLDERNNVSNKKNVDVVWMLRFGMENSIQNCARLIVSSCLRSQIAPANLT